MDMFAGRGGDFARRVAQRRSELGLTQGDLARRAGMDGGYLDYLEQALTWSCRLAR